MALQVTAGAGVCAVLKGFVKLKYIIFSKSCVTPAAPERDVIQTRSRWPPCYASEALLKIFA